MMLVALWHQSVLDVILTGVIKRCGLAGDVFRQHGVIDMRGVLAGLLLLGRVIRSGLGGGGRFLGACCDRGLDRGANGRFRVRCISRRFGCRGSGYDVVVTERLIGLGIMDVMFMIVMIVRVLVISMIAVRLMLMTFMFMTLVLVGVMIVSFMIMAFMTRSLVAMMFGVMRVILVVLVVLVIAIGLWRLRGIELTFDDRALDAVATATPPRIAVTGTAPMAGAVLAFLFGLAMGTLVRLDQRLTISHRNLVIVRMNFAEGKEAVTVAAIFNEGRLQGRFYPRDLGEIDIAA
jgi:hypothetical protein